MAINIIFGAIVIVGFIIGIKLMQSPGTAVWGNRIGALSMVAGFVFAIIQFGVADEIIFWLFILIGVLLGAILAGKVQMIQMPQTVALFNGSGGGASAAVATVSALLYSTEGDWIFFFTSALALAIGSLTLFGSIIAAGKLQGWFSQESLNINGHNNLLVALLIIGALLVIISPAYNGMFFVMLWPFLLIISALYGFFMAIRIGGADMPVLISFLNSLSGIAAAVCGLAIEHIILVGAGALVGMAGLILTIIMCKAMNRSLKQVFSGIKPSEKEQPDQIGVDQEDYDAVKHHETTDEPAEKEIELTPLDSAKTILDEANKVIIVPGYGLAVAQAQQELKQLIDLLEAEETEVKLAIHPVAGRMPGHMNVLLAEIGIDYDKLSEMDTINPEFPETDAVIVIGACDVVNPAASTSEGTPISGMPILEAHNAKNVIVCNLDDSPGYSGVPNTLYGKDNVILVWGDAKENINNLYSILKNDKDG
ncbi:NAD(P)(+) transhydrogenase (Re/Si-specific) subunit beta [Natranaerofaba carboxydovora]|uniref:NAD(P)(+) transhydrogenase (Re/Si-specific) subunit beta n=1 Tax=Natranaerofaba carboxydovora TaxID=2742683 RepID=UPI001F136AAE|nr:NAD(P)(+) transhydrogenase (Re/Si-specific) subunit beta [Natranaerofaba carboxydovora]UMZ73654.1 NAD(P) transhydrogenase subunit beta [Natranaerofaba carboxydovora]